MTIKIKSYNNKIKSTFHSRTHKDRSECVYLSTIVIDSVFKLGKTVICRRYDIFWDIFRFIFRQLRMTFSHKVMVVEKKYFRSNRWHNFVKEKVISKCKNDKPWEN